jgi:Tol biopolymer transport system component
VGNIWSVDVAEPRRVRQLTFGTNVENAVQTFDVADDGSIVFIARRDGYDQILALGPQGGVERQLTSEPARHFGVRALRGGGISYVRADEQNGAHVWRADNDGSNPRQLTFGAGEVAQAASPMGTAILYESSERQYELWSIPAEGGKPMQLAPSHFDDTVFSGDGRFIATFNVENDRLVLKIIPAGGGPASTLVLPPGATDIEWRTGDASITYLDAADSSRNVHRQSIAGGRPQLVTHFAHGTIQSHRWARDGSHLLVARRLGDLANVWVGAPDGSHMVQVTNFATGDILDMNTSLDWRRVIFGYGTTSHDAVLIRKFR